MVLATHFPEGLLVELWHSHVNNCWAAREGNAQSRNTFHICRKKTKQRTELPRVYLFQVVWRTALEIDLELTQNNYVELLDLYLRRMPYLNTLFDEVVSPQGSCRNNSLPGSHGKSFNLAQVSTFV